MDRARFKPITKSHGSFFTRCRAVTPLANSHAAINRNQAGIGIEAKREEETNKEESNQFREGDHNKYFTLKSLFSKCPQNQARV